MDGDVNVRNIQFLIGLQNLADKYLTAESFGNRISASAAGLGTKQTFRLIFNGDETVSLQGNFSGCFVSSDRFGNITCCKNDLDGECKYSLIYLVDGSGRCSLKHMKHGFYIGGMDDKLHCLAKTASENEMSLWYIHLANKQQGILYNLDKSRHVTLHNNSELRSEKDAAWGPNSLITLEYSNGKYAIKAANNKYLTKEGTLVDDHGSDTKFSLELKMSPEGSCAGLLFRDIDGNCLKSHGTFYTLKFKDKSPVSSHYFLFGDVPTEVFITAANGKNASVSHGSGTDGITAQTTERSNTEIFQLNFHESVKKWTLKSVNGFYWSLGPGASIISNGKDVADDTLFDIAWCRDGTATIKAPNKNYISFNVAKVLLAKSPEFKNNDLFQIRLANRPILILKGVFGFVGVKANSRNMECGCNKFKADSLVLEHGENGSCYIKGTNGKYWAVGDGNKIYANDTSPKPFIIELMSGDVMAIRAPNEKYISGEKNGDLVATCDSVNKLSTWRF